LSVSRIKKAGDNQKVLTENLKPSYHRPINEHIYIILTQAYTKEPTSTKKYTRNDAFLSLFVILTSHSLPQKLCSIFFAIIVVLFPKISATHLGALLRQREQDKAACLVHNGEVWLHSGKAVWKKSSSSVFWRGREKK
jgi:hypothetical protein